jgi:hypothetical protein
VTHQLCLTSAKTLHFQVVSFHLETKVGKFFHRPGKVLFSPFGQRLVETILQKNSLRIKSLLINDLILKWN